MKKTQIIILVLGLLSCSKFFNSDNTQTQKERKYHCPIIGTYYPKQITDTLRIEIITSLASDQYEVKDIKGKVYKTGEIGEGITIVDCRNLKVGEYTLAFKNCDTISLSFEKVYSK